MDCMLKDRDLDHEFVVYQRRLQRRARIRVQKTWDDVWPGVAIAGIMALLFVGLPLLAIFDINPGLWEKIIGVFR